MLELCDFPELSVSLFEEWASVEPLTLLTVEEVEMVLYEAECGTWEPDTSYNSDAASESSWSPNSTHSSELSPFLLKEFEEIEKLFSFPQGDLMTNEIGNLSIDCDKVGLEEKIHVKKEGPHPMPESSKNISEEEIINSLTAMNPCNLNAAYVESLMNMQLGNLENRLCTMCGKIFRSKSDLMRHMPVHTGAYIVCDDCGYKCKSRQRITRHYRSSRCGYIADYERYNVFPSETGVKKKPKKSPGTRPKPY